MDSIGSDIAVDEDSRPHAVAMPFPTQGHINPLMHFCRALASKGFVITFVNTESNQQSMQKNIPGDGVDFRLESIPDGLPVPISQFDFADKDNRVQFHKAVADMEAPFEKLLRGKIAKRGPPVSCIVTDLFLKWSQDVAERLGVPRVVFWTTTAACLLIEYHIPQMLENGDIPVHDPLSDKLVSYIPGLSPLPLGSLPFPFSGNDSASDPGFVRRIARTQIVADAPWILTNSFEELEGDAFEASRTAINPNSIAVGPLLPPEFLSQETNTTDRRRTGAGNPSLWKEDTECLVWLDAYEPESVLFVSFGSMATLSMEQFEELEAGLELLRQPFVWVVRPSSVSGLQPEAFEAFRHRAREAGLGLVVSWAPQLEVLRHAATGGFLTHCGWNSTLESICAGVPLLCWPCVAEQSLNCKLLVDDWKIGLRFSNALTRGLVERHEFVGVVRRLMGADNDAVGAELRKNVRGLGDAARKAVSDGGSSQRNLQKFIDGITGSRKQAPQIIRDQPRPT